MQAALGDSHHSVLESEFASRKPASSIISSSTHNRIVIVPAAGAVRPATFNAVAQLLDAGATVLWESGATFLDSADFAQQRALMNVHFGISIGQPIHVWSNPTRESRNLNDPMQNARGMRVIGHEQIPYVEYCWPLNAHVRDFSRVIPVSASSGLAIAHWEEATVAWRKNIGAGALIFLGSPLGPALRAGDPEATALLQSIRASASK